VDRGRDAYVRRFELVHEYREFPLLDPFLPRPLQPADWAGECALALFQAYHALLSGPADAWLAGGGRVAGVPPGCCRDVTPQPASSSVGAATCPCTPRRRDGPFRVPSADTFGFREVRYAKADWVATVTIDRPHNFNAYSTAALEELTSAFRDAAFDDAVGVSC
jgi:hypothetical protein